MPINLYTQLMDIVGLLPIETYKKKAPLSISYGPCSLSVYVALVLALLG